uniref:hypothetical protein n=1 Tax=Desulfotalea psychrophila TaxID=84980 RepID=UPI0012E9BF79|nr:hypothetical protein [Desulfotalea psychrophila]
MLYCLDEPVLPETLTGANVGGYILELSAAYRDCKRTLAEVQQWAVEGEAP